MDGLRSQTEVSHYGYPHFYDFLYGVAYFLSAFELQGIASRLLHHLYGIIHTFASVGCRNRTACRR